MCAYVGDLERKLRATYINADDRYGIYKNENVPAAFGRKHPCMVVMFVINCGFVL